MIAEPQRSLVAFQKELSGELGTVVDQISFTIISKLFCFIRAIYNLVISSNLHAVVFCSVQNVRAFANINVLTPALVAYKMCI